VTSEKRSNRLASIRLVDNWIQTVRENVVPHFRELAGPRTLLGPTDCLFTKRIIFEERNPHL
jgi:hypothetical protein